MTQRESDHCAEQVQLGNVYALLARMWLREVDAELVTTLNNEELRPTLEAVGGVVPREDDIDELAVEYCRLFVGPKDHLPPYQSVWESGELQSEIVSSVNLFVEALRYEPPTATPNTMHDHLGTQLDLMGRATLMQSDSPDSTELKELRRELYLRHLCWPTKLFDSLERRTTSPFYLALAAMTRTLLASEMES